MYISMIKKRDLGGLISLWVIKNCNYVDWFKDWLIDWLIDWLMINYL